MARHEVDDVVALIRYCKVTKSGLSDISVEDLDDGSEFQIHGAKLVDTLLTASKFEKTEEKPLMDVASIVSTSYNTPMTVCFTKKNGEKRILTGRLCSSEPILGRSYMEDLKEKDSRLRLVDHRTIEWAVVRGVKYCVK